MAWLIRTLAVGGALYGILLVTLYLAQRRMIYPAPPGGQEPFYPPCTRVDLEDADGLPGLAMYAPSPSPEGPVVVTFHGNGEDLSHQGDLALGLLASGCGFLGVEFPGYSLLSDQSPSEAGIYAAGEAAVAWLRAQGVGPERTVLWGRSLGSGAAVELARRGHASRLVLISPFTSMVAMAGRVAPYAPVSLLLEDRFDNLAKAGDVTVPTLVLHGDRDEVIPVEMGELLAEALPQATFVALEGQGHNDLALHRGSPILERVAHFLGTLD